MKNLSLIKKSINKSFQINQDYKNFSSKIFEQVLQNKTRVPRIENDIKLDFKDVLIRPQLTSLSSRREVNLQRKFNFRHSETTWQGVPIMAANMDTVGTLEIAEVFAKYHMITCLHKHFSSHEIIDWGKRVGAQTLNNIAVTAGVSDRDYHKVKEMLDELKDIKFICLDVANGYQGSFIKRVEFYRTHFPTHILIAGNVVTNEITQILLQAGADIIKLGIGPGSVCTTRRQTGVGYPQLSTILENSPVAHSLGGLVISDGGCTVPGDFSKAFCAGADFVMSGGMFAGHDESGGENIVDEKTGRQFKKFYGMSSGQAMEKYSGGLSSYRSSEGKLVYLPAKGPIENTVLDLLGGIRSTCTYVGSQSIEELPGNTTFVRVSQQLNEIYGKAPEPFEASKN